MQNSHKKETFFRKTGNLEFLVLGGVILIISVFYFINLPNIPFHPDESTQIFMSGDFEQFFQSPSSLIWEEGKPLDVRMKYRLLDAPFIREWIGAFMAISGTTPTTVDWDWSADWEQNEKAGALPSPQQLFIGRLSSAIFFPLELLLLFQIGKKLKGNLLGWLMLLVFAVNALVLLHSRRAMSEGSLLFFIILSLWVFLLDRKYLYLAAIPAALAFNSKYSALPIFLLGLFVIIYRNLRSQATARQIVLQEFLYCGIFALITFLLNPFLWGSPVKALSQALLLREDLLARQITDLGRISQGWISDSPGKRFASLIGNLFITPLAFHDVGNYIRETISAENHYLQIPLQNFMRGYLGGAVTFLLALLGFVFALRDAIKKKGNYPFLVILILGTSIQFVFLWIAFTIPFQRYVSPLVPYVTIWVAYSLHEITIRIKNIQAAV